MDPASSSPAILTRIRDTGRRGAAFGRDFSRRHSRLLWGLHSAWALLSGVAVLVLAHNRYGFLRWAVLFIALTWGSTLFFARVASAGSSRAMRVARSVVSYLTRVMYQETLFFLVPFYFYSSTFPSWNSAYLIVLSGLAILSCFDLLFDRLLREKPWLSITFFAFVSFSALQLFLPLLLRMRIDNGAYVAAAISYVAAVLLALPESLRAPRRAAVAVLALFGVLALVRVAHPLLPPVPLRLTSLRFSGTLDPRTLTAPVGFERTVPISALSRGRLYAVATVFSPERIPARVQMRFIQDGKVLRVSRLLDLTARPGGFRMWDSLRQVPRFHPGTVRVEVWTGEGQLLGLRRVQITAR